MFEATKVGRKVGKQDFKEQVTKLRTELLDTQRRLADSGVPVIVLVSGIEAAGKGEVVDRLNEWMDTRGVQTWAFWDESDEDRERPRYWRFWNAMPPRGQIGVLFGGWYQEPLERHMHGKCSDKELEAELARIEDFERMLSVDGALIVKFWFHMSEKDQKARFKKLSRDDRSRWSMMPEKAKFSEHYARFERLAERVIRETDTGIAPWYLIEAANTRYRDLAVGKTLLEAIKTRLDNPMDTSVTHTTRSPSLPNLPDAQRTLLDKLDMDKDISDDDYKRRLDELQGELNELAWAAYKAKRSTILVFEGSDAGGKGGAIRRITNAVDSRLYRTIQVAAPTDEERARHYLWRFWRHVPRAGRMTVYDRSWYGRVLVERVEGFATEAQWSRSYYEINEFEEELSEAGIIVVKFWLHITKEEQLRRFKEREVTPHKQHKITDEDWRNREKWDEYVVAVNDMINRTSTQHAPWVVIPGNDKRYARVAVLEAVTRALRKALKGK
ncbi:MAG: polyphosphate:AMP phosphotransferase [Gammaproteobacteria bacterium]|nr:polyphosphate:AMP phosphotransferase [Gammaproteobacteria bacterium]MCP5137167.1 polyphosphate:AMP phosphotransferase [Gammaproteobacteria bacterium]